MVTTYVGMSVNRRNRVLHLGLHHFNPPSLNSKFRRKGKLEKNTTVLQGTKGCKLKHKFQEQWTIVFLLSILSYSFNVPRGPLYSFSKG